MSDFVNTVRNHTNNKNMKQQEKKRKQLYNSYKEEKKLRKLEKENKVQPLPDEVDTKKGRKYTISIALPGSILDNAQSPELRTYLAGQVARAAVVFQVDEIVVFDESCCCSSSKSTEGEYKGIGKKGNADVQLARILQYLECPQYLRKLLFPKHADLQYAGLLNPLDSPHHMKVTDIVPYREGVVLDRPTKEGRGSFVDCGALKQVRIDKVLQPHVRVTVKMNNDHKGKTMKGTVVSPTTPRESRGLYWGYHVRLAESLSDVFTTCPFAKKYDLTIGTSEKGNNVDNSTIRPFEHLLIVFGGVKGLEESLENDSNFEDIPDPKLLFDMYLNTCPNQGSGTIRTEEAILITMSALRPLIVNNVK